MGGRSQVSMAKHDGLQIDEDLAFQRRSWRWQRAGWLGFVALIVAGLLGVFGAGPLSRAESSGAGLRIEYDRFARTQAPTSLVIHIDGGAARAGAVRLVLGGDYIHAAQIQSTTLPVLGITGGGIVLGADLMDSAERLIVAVHLTFLRPGAMKAQIGLLGQRAADLTFLVYP